MAARIVELLTNAPSVPLLSRSLYLTVMTLQPQSIQSLATVTGGDRSTVSAHCRALERLGWIRLTAHGREVRPEAVVPPDIEAIIASDISRVIAVSPFKGEETAKFFLEWTLAPTVQLIYRARPDFLRNPDTGQNLEYDVFAPDYAWAAEYQGDQHFGPTQLYPGDRQFVERFARDLLKVNISRQRGIRLSVITKHDLKLDRILQSIPADIPRRAFDRDGPVIQLLEKLGSEISGRHEQDRE